MVVGEFLGCAEIKALLWGWVCGGQVEWGSVEVGLIDRTMNKLKITKLTRK
jgi:hypothetical protein